MHQPFFPDSIDSPQFMGRESLHDVYNSPPLAAILIHIVNHVHALPIS
jgi:hypothetical protein